MKKKLMSKKVKKYQNGEIIGTQPISYDTWKKWQEMLPEYQKSLEDLAILQYADNKAKYGDDVPEEAKYLYSMGLLPEVEVTSSKKLNKKEQYLADLQWRNYLATHPIRIGSEEYNRLSEKAKAQVFKNGVTDAIDKAALPTAAAIIAPTALTAGAASLVGSGALTAVADAAGKIGTKIAGTNLGKAASAFINNPYIDAGLTAIGAYTVPSLYNSGVLNIKEGNYGRAAGDFGSIGLELLGGAGMIKNFKNVVLPFKMINGENFIHATQPSATNKLSLWFKTLKKNYSIFSNHSDYAHNKHKQFENVWKKLYADDYELYKEKIKLSSLKNDKQNDLYTETLRGPYDYWKEHDKIQQLFPNTYQRDLSRNLFNPDAWYTNYLKYLADMLDPVSVDHNTVYKNNIKAVSEILGDVPFKMTGSSILNGKGITYSQTVADDADFLIRKKDALNLAEKYDLELNKNGTAFRNSIVNGIKINPLFIDETEDGFAIGRVGVLYFQLKYPKEYYNFIKYCQNNNLDITKTPLPIKAEDLFNNITEEDVIVRGLMDNMISTSPKNMDKHLNRTLHSMFSTDLNNILYYQNALKLLMESLFGEYNNVEKLFPNIKFDNTEDNLKFLKDLLEISEDNEEIIPYLKKIASDPERMKVIANSLLSTYSTSARHTQGIDNKYEGKIVNKNMGLGVNIINPKGDTGGGHLGGAGTNSSLGKAPEGYGNYESIFNYPITYTPEKFTLLLDLNKQIRSLQDVNKSREFEYIAGEDMSVNSKEKLDLINDLSKKYDMPVFLNPNNRNFIGYSGILSNPYHVNTVRIGDDFENPEGFWELPHEMINIKNAFPNANGKYRYSAKLSEDHEIPFREQFLQYLKNRENELVKIKQDKLGKIESEISDIDKSILKVDLDRVNLEKRKNKINHLEEKYERNKKDYKKKKNVIKTTSRTVGGVGAISGLTYGAYKIASNSGKEYTQEEIDDMTKRRMLLKELSPLYDNRLLRKYSNEELLKMIENINLKNQYKNGGILNNPKDQELQHKCEEKLKRN